VQARQCLQTITSKRRQANAASVLAVHTVHEPR
jgi:hypothetical protein